MNYRTNFSFFGQICVYYDSHCELATYHKVSLDVDFKNENKMPSQSLIRTQGFLMTSG